MKKIFFFLVITITIAINYIISDPSTAKADDPSASASPSASSEVSESPEPIPPDELIQNAINSASSNSTVDISSIISEPLEILEPIEIDLKGHSLGLGNLGINFSGASTLKLLNNGTLFATFSKGSSSEDSLMNGSTAVITPPNNSIFNINNITMQNIEIATNACDLKISDSTLSEYSKINCSSNNLEFLRSTISDTSKLTSNKLTLDTTIISGSNETTCTDDIVFKNSSISGNYVIKTANSKTITIQQDGNNVFKFEAKSASAKIESSNSNAEINSENKFIKNSKIHDMDITVGYENTYMSSSERNKLFQNVYVDGNYSITIIKGNFLTLASSTNKNFILKATERTSDNTDYLNTTIEKRSSSDRLINSELSSDLSKLEGLKLSNVDIELGNDTAKSLTDIELAGEFKILLKQGEKLNFVYTANSTPKTILIFEPTEQGEGYISSRPAETTNTNDRHNYDSTVRTSNPPSIKDEHFVGLIIQDLNIDVGINADTSISKYIKYSKIIGNEDHEVEIIGYDLIHRKPDFEHVVTEHTKMYAKLTKNEEISNDKHIDIIANTYLDMQNYNLTFKGNGSLNVEKNKKLYINNNNKKLYIFNANHDTEGTITSTATTSTTAALKSTSSELYYLYISNMDIDIGIDADSNIVRRITYCNIEGVSEENKVEILGYPLIGQNLIVTPSLDSMLHYAEVHSFLESNKGQLNSSNITIDSNETIELQKHDLVLTNSSFKITNGAELIIKNEGKKLYSFKGENGKVGYLSVKPKINAEFRLNPSKMSGFIIKDLNIVPDNVPITIENCEIYSEKVNVLIGSNENGASNNIIVYNSLFEAKNPSTKTLTLNHAKLSGFNTSFNNTNVKNTVSNDLCLSSSNNSAIYIKGNVSFENVNIDNTKAKSASNSAVALIHDNANLTLKGNTSITNTTLNSDNKTYDLICDTSKKNVKIKLYDNATIDNLLFKNTPSSSNIFYVDDSFNGDVNLTKTATNTQGEPKNNEWVNTSSKSFNLDKIKKYPENLVSIDSSCINKLKTSLANDKIKMNNFNYVIDKDDNLIGNAKANIDDMTSLYIKDNKLYFGMYQYNISFSNNYDKATATCTNEGTPYYNKNIVCNFTTNPSFSPSGIETYKKAGKTTFFDNLEEHLDSYDITDSSTTNYSIKNTYSLYPLNKSYTKYTLDNLITNEKHRGLIEALRLCTKIDNTGTDFSDINKETYDSTITFNNIKKFTKIKNNDYLLIDMSNARVDGGEANYLKNLCSLDGASDFDDNLLKDDAIEKIDYSNLQKGKIYIEAYKNLNNDNLSIDIFYYPNDNEYLSLTNEKNVNDKKLILLKNGTDYNIKSITKLGEDNYKINIEGKKHFYNSIERNVVLYQCLLEKEYTGKIQYGSVANATGYSTDNGANWTSLSPYFTNIGSYVYKYKTSSKTYDIQFAITPAKISLTWTNASFTYNGKKQAPSIKSITDATKKLNKNNISLTIYKKVNNKYSKVNSSIDAGSYKITASINTSNNSYKLAPNIQSKTYTIKAKNIGKYIKLKYNTVLAYNGKKIIPSIKVTYGKKTLTKNKDYKLVTSNSKKVSKYTATVSLINNYSGSKKLTYYIKYSIKKAKITAKKKRGKIYITVKYAKSTLKLNKDYKLKKVYKNKVTKITITGIGKYAFTKQISIK